MREVTGKLFGFGRRGWVEEWRFSAAFQAPIEEGFSPGEQRPPRLKASSRASGRGPARAALPRWCERHGVFAAPPAMSSFRNDGIAVEEPAFRPALRREMRRASAPLGARLKDAKPGVRKSHQGQPSNPTLRLRSGQALLKSAKGGAPIACLRKILRGRAGL